MSGYLEIDAKKTVEKLEEHMRSLYEEHAASGVIMGLSGGIDSAVLLTLAVRALGRERVHTAYLYDRNSSHAIHLHARTMAQWLGVDLEESSIEDAMLEKDIYKSVGMGVRWYSGLYNRFAHAAYRLAIRETPFLSVLRNGSAERPRRNPIRRWLDGCLRGFEVGQNARHQYRRRVLEEKARDRNWLLLGAANRTECLLGWFVKGGIDDLPMQPLNGLYKTQLRQIADFLDIPPAVRGQIASPDMMSGISDETALGLTYPRVDLILDCLQGGLDLETILKAGCTEREIRVTREMNRLSGWKRGPAPPSPPIDGGPRSPLRLSHDA